MSQRCVEISQSLEVLDRVIIQEWEVAVREKIRSSEQEGSLVLQDHIPEMLRQLRQILESGKLSEHEIGQAHGFQRAILTEYSLAELLMEISILRCILVDYLYPLGDVTCAKIIHGYLDVVCKNSVVEFLKGVRLTGREETRIHEESPESEEAEVKQLLDQEPPVGLS